MEAGVVSFFRTALIILLIYYGFRFLTRYLFPIILKRVVKKRFKSKNPSKKTETKEKRTKDELGEYIDFEEIND